MNLFFRLAAAAGGAFVLTIFALIAAVMGDAQAPAARFLDDYGGTMITVEVAATLVFGWIAMAVDRIRPSAPSHATEHDLGTTGSRGCGSFKSEFRIPNSETNSNNQGSNDRNGGDREF